MVNNIVKLTVHKNNKIQKDKKFLRGEAIKNTKLAVAPQNVAGYLVMSWTDDLSVNIHWRINSNSPLNLAGLPPFLAQSINRKLNQLDKE